ncbi:MAG: hypothetical protein Q4G27_01875 [Flavobacteriaceae bacterium]|nr:hypothetical protein [Flavobacteriaceae bacterium]
MYKLSFTILILWTLISCVKTADERSFEKNVNSNNSEILQKDLEKEVDTTFIIKKRTFVDAGYSKRHEGSDWIAIDVDSIAPDTVSFKVFARNDIKKATCNFYSKAYELEKGIYKSIHTDPVVLLTLDGEKLHIGTASKEDDQKLMFYCSGGGNFIGDYDLLKEPMDTIKLDTIH